MLTLEKFNDKYGYRGGFAKLNEMIRELKTQNEICAHFKIGKETLRDWSRKFFGKQYDPRVERREKKVEILLNIMRTNSEKRCQWMLKHENREYYTEALFLAYKEGTYKKPSNSTEMNTNHVPTTFSGT